LSVSQWQRPLLLQVASLTGGAGIAFVLISFNLGLAFYLHTLWHKRKESWIKRLSLEFYLALVFLLGAVAFGIHSSGAGFRGRIEGPRLAFIQPDVGVMQKWDPKLVRENLQLLKDLSTYASYLDADVILWPEAPTPLPILGNHSMRQWVEALSTELDLAIIAGNVAREDGADGSRKWYNAVFYVDPNEGVDIENYYAKRRLVPFGEYVPLSHLFPFIEKFVPIEGSFYMGEAATPLKPHIDASGIGKVGNLICYEDIFPGLARDNVRAGADWHFVATNNAWFGEEAGAWQHAAHSVLRAVETRRPVVRCGNAGWSGWIDEFGHIRHVMMDNTGSIYFQGVEVIPLERNTYWNNRLSYYVRKGDWFIGACCAVAFLGLWLGGIFKRKGA
jgi:apolipoprotein N-acyltransferase